MANFKSNKLLRKKKWGEEKREGKEKLITLGIGKKMAME